MNTRLDQFIAAENISKAEFADNIGVARASVSHILAGRNKPSYDFITGIMQRYPRLNMEWLLAGKGKMYKDLSVSPVPEAAPAYVPPTDDREPDREQPDLFSMEENETTTPRESIISRPDELSPADSAATEGESVPEYTPKTTVNQRKIAKIVVFYDDNTYQELS